MLMVEAPLLLRVEEVAQLLGLGRTRTFQMVSAGQLPVVRIGRFVRIPRAALEEWIAERTAPPTDLYEVG
jgi:excisionase family DNA binding protein